MRSRAKPTPALDAFAALLAKGYEPDAAARAMGLTHPKSGNALLQRLRKRLGAQAI